jgi:putative transposase
MAVGLVSRDDGWRLPDESWARMEALLPPRPLHPLGCHNPRVPDRDAMDAILLVLRTGMQWNALNATGICSSSSAHRRFQEWTEAGVFEEFWRQGLLAYDRLKGIEWEWLSCDGELGKAPLGGARTGPNPTDRAKRGRSDRSSAKAAASQSGLSSRARTSTTSSFSARRSPTS